ncbi:Dihydroorotase-like protein [Usitatibacter rugosus]|uniref:Dihydroorotase-like protein n=1 Tax=Usitatibacter rugosus TaxID=2732067 RepID=A0A6M4H2Z0_9PROT|nr:dihydroorotase [Usitatibacter rugosus]QJR13093.1 Dihydroorotase-like protein [Usitatibacter rugosus]
MKIEIRGARLVDPAANTEANASLFIAEGRIASTGKAPDGFKPDEVIEAGGLVLCPGLVDLAARLREPGFEYKATLESEMRAAVAGGVTTLACPPDTDPPLDEPGLVEMLTRRAASLHQARVHPLGALTVGLKGEKLAEMLELTEAGCVGFFQANAPIRDLSVLLQAMRYASTFGFTVWLRPQVADLARDGVAHEGEVATRLGLAPIPAIAETIAVRAIVELMGVTGARVHLARLSSARSVALVAEAKAKGLPLTCDVGIYHLHLSDRDIGEFDPLANFVPPLRDPRDRDALRKGVADGTIDAICSDHTPVDDDEKLVPFAEATPGATGLELLLPLVLQWGSESGLKLPATLGAVTHRPARILGAEAGTLAPGAAADLCLFDPKSPWIVSPLALASQGKNTPFMGLELSGRVARTLVGGRTVHLA